MMKRLRDYYKSEKNIRWYEFSIVKIFFDVSKRIVTPKANPEKRKLLLVYCFKDAGQYLLI